MMKKNILFLFVLLMMIYSCTSTKKTDNACVNPPIKNVAVKYSNYEVNAQSGAIIKLPNKGSIIVPPTAFVDKDGKTVLGKVTLFYREFRTVGDIIVSGIPMTYDSAAVRQNFQSAGMFEIWGAQNDVPVYIAPGKNIEVNMLSTRIGDNYNFYFLDTTANNWEYKGTAKPVVQIDSAGGDSIATAGFDSIPAETSPAVKKDVMVFDLNFKTKGKEDELKDLHGILWQYAGDKKEEDPEAQSWIFKTQWTDINLVLVDSTKLIYELNLSKPKKTFKTYITPSFSEKEYEKSVAKFKKKVARYNQKVYARREENLIRSFTVSKFGVYNWDRYFKRPSVEVKLKIKYKDNSSGHRASLYNVITSEGVVIRYNPDGDMNVTFRFFPEEQNTLIFLFDDGQMAYVTAAEFRAMKMESGGVYDITPGVTVKVRSAADIDELMKKI